MQVRPTRLFTGYLSHAQLPYLGAHLSDPTLDDLNLPEMPPIPAVADYLA